ncbi:hypothetical protein GGF31_002336 [Allomyces arbusculus]|nr:hypothetical protein GGF31_002336 [Allomyces arbusculus]
MPSLSALSGSSGSSSKGSSSGGRRSFFRRRSRRPSTLVSESTVHDVDSATDHDDVPAADDASRRPAWRSSTASHSSAVAHHLHHHGDRTQQQQHHHQHDHGHEDGATTAAPAHESGRKPTGMLAKAALWTFTALAVVAVTPFRLAHAVGLDGSSDSSSSNAADARRSTSREPMGAGAAAASAPPPLPPPRASTASAATARAVTLALHDEAGAAARMSHDVHRIPPPMSPLAHSLDEDSELEDDDWQDEPRGRSRVRRHYSPAGIYSAAASASLASASSPHKTGAALSAVVLPARTVSLGSPGPVPQGSLPTTGPQRRTTASASASAAMGASTFGVPSGEQDDAAWETDRGAHDRMVIGAAAGPSAPLVGLLPPPPLPPACPPPARPPPAGPPPAVPLPAVPTTSSRSPFFSTSNTNPPVLPPRRRGPPPAALVSSAPELGGHVDLNNNHNNSNDADADIDSEAYDDVPPLALSSPLLLPDRDHDPSDLPSDGSSATSTMSFAPPSPLSRRSNRSSTDGSRASSGVPGFWPPSPDLRAALAATKARAVAAVSGRSQPAPRSSSSTTSTSTTSSSTRPKPTTSAVASLASRFTGRSSSSSAPPPPTPARAPARATAAAAARKTTTSRPSTPVSGSAPRTASSNARSTSPARSARSARSTASVRPASPAVGRTASPAPSTASSARRGSVTTATDSGTSSVRVRKRTTSVVVTPAQPVLPGMVDPGTTPARAATPTPRASLSSRSTSGSPVPSTGKSPTAATATAARARRPSLVVAPGRTGTPTPPRSQSPVASAAARRTSPTRFTSPLHGTRNVSGDRASAGPGRVAGMVRMFEVPSTAAAPAPRSSSRSSSTSSRAARSGSPTLSSVSSRAGSHLSSLGPASPHLDSYARRSSVMNLLAAAPVTSAVAHYQGAPRSRSASSRSPSAGSAASPRTPMRASPLATNKPLTTKAPDAKIPTIPSESEESEPDATTTASKSRDTPTSTPPPPPLPTITTLPTPAPSSPSSPADNRSPLALRRDSGVIPPLPPLVIPSPRVFVPASGMHTPTTANSSGILTPRFAAMNSAKRMSIVPAYDSSSDEEGGPVGSLPPAIHAALLAYTRTPSPPATAVAALVNEPAVKATDSPEPKVEVVKTEPLDLTSPGSETNSPEPVAPAAEEPVSSKEVAAAAPAPVPAAPASGPKPSSDVVAAASVEPAVPAAPAAAAAADETDVEEEVIEETVEETIIEVIGNLSRRTSRVSSRRTSDLDDAARALTNPDYDCSTVVTEEDDRDEATPAAAAVAHAADTVSQPQVEDDEPVTPPAVPVKDTAVSSPPTPPKSAPSLARLDLLPSLDLGIDLTATLAAPSPVTTPTRLDTSAPLPSPTPSLGSSRSGRSGRARPPPLVLAAAAAPALGPTTRLLRTPTISRVTAFRRPSRDVKSVFSTILEDVPMLSPSLYPEAAAAVAIAEADAERRGRRHAAGESHLKRHVSVASSHSSTAGNVDEESVLSLVVGNATVHIPPRGDSKQHAAAEGDAEKAVVETVEENKPAPLQVPQLAPPSQPQPQAEQPTQQTEQQSQPQPQPDRANGQADDDDDDDKSEDVSERNRSHKHGDETPEERRERRRLKKLRKEALKQDLEVARHRKRNTRNYDESSNGNRASRPVSQLSSGTSSVLSAAAIEDAQQGVSRRTTVTSTDTGIDADVEDNGTWGRGDRAPPVSFQSTSSSGDSGIATEPGSGVKTVTAPVRRSSANALATKRMSGSHMATARLTTSTTNDEEHDSGIGSSYYSSTIDGLSRQPSDASTSGMTTGSNAAMHSPGFLEVYFEVDPTVDVLSLRGRKIQALPEGVFRQFDHLVALDLSSNKLKNLPASLARLVSLRDLNVRENCLAELPVELQALEHLQVLNVSINELAAIPPWIHELKELHYLDIRTNKITHLPLELGMLSKLDTFLVDNNPWDASFKPLMSPLLSPNGVSSTSSGLYEVMSSDSQDPLQSQLSRTMSTSSGSTHRSITHHGGATSLDRGRDRSRSDADVASLMSAGDSYIERRGRSKTPVGRRRLDKEPPMSSTTCDTATVLTIETQDTRSIAVEEDGLPPLPPLPPSPAPKAAIPTMSVSAPATAVTSPVSPVLGRRKPLPLLNLSLTNDPALFDKVDKTAPPPTPITYQRHSIDMLKLTHLHEERRSSSSGESFDSTGSAPVAPVVERSPVPKAEVGNSVPHAIPFMRRSFDRPKPAPVVGSPPMAAARVIELSRLPVAEPKLPHLATSPSLGAEKMPPPPVRSSSFGPAVPMHPPHTTAADDHRHSHSPSRKHLPKLAGLFKRHRDESRSRSASTSRQPRRTSDDSTFHFSLFSKDKDKELHHAAPHHRSSSTGSHRRDVTWDSVAHAAAVGNLLQYLHDAYDLMPEHAETEALRRFQRGETDLGMARATSLSSHSSSGTSSSGSSTHHGSSSHHSYGHQHHHHHTSSIYESTMSLESKQLPAVPPKIELVPHAACDLKKRARIVAEIIATEETYVQELTFLVTHYYRPIMQQHLLSSDEYRLLFANVDSILAFHKDYFLKALHEPDGSERIGRIFVKHAAYLKMYSMFISNADKGISELSRWLSKRKKLRAFLAETAKKPGHHQINLQSYLLLPIQRIPRYRLLLRDLVKHTPVDHPDYADLSLALAEVERRADEINERKRDQENVDKLVAIHARLRGSGHMPFPLVQPHRRLVREGSLYVVRFVTLPNPPSAAGMPGAGAGLRHHAAPGHDHHHHNHAAMSTTAAFAASTLLASSPSTMSLKAAISGARLLAAHGDKPLKNALTAPATPPLPKLHEHMLHKDFQFFLFNDLLIMCKREGAGDKLLVWRSMPLTTKVTPASWTRNGEVRVVDACGVLYLGGNEQELVPWVSDINDRFLH